MDDSMISDNNLKDMVFIKAEPADIADFDDGYENYQSLAAKTNEEINWPEKYWIYKKIKVDPDAEFHKSTLDGFNATEITPRIKEETGFLENFYAYENVCCEFQNNTIIKEEIVNPPDSLYEYESLIEKSFENLPEKGNNLLRPTKKGSQKRKCEVMSDDDRCTENRRRKIRITRSDTYAKQISPKQINLSFSSTEKDFVEVQNKQTTETQKLQTQSSNLSDDSIIETLRSGKFKNDPKLFNARVILENIHFSNDLRGNENKSPRTNSSPNYKCSRCQNLFRSEKSLKVHKRYCGIPPHLFCKFCPHRTKYADGLRTHMKSFHKNQIKSDNELKKIVRQIVQEGETLRADSLKLLQEKSTQSSVLKSKRINKNLTSLQSSKCEPNFLNDVHGKATTQNEASGSEIEEKNLSILQSSGSEQEINRYCRKCSIACDANAKKSTKNCPECGGSLIFECKKCNLTLNTYVTMSRHVNTICYPKYTFSCSYCSYEVHRKEYLMKHMQLKHKIG